MSDIHGLHHVSGMCGDAQTNVNFYAGVLGMRLVKKTVNFDDLTAYHLYYGDASGNPGSILTFFPYPRARQGQLGTGQTSAVALAVPRSSLGFWSTHLDEHGVEVNAEKRFHDDVLVIHDPDGLRVELVGVEMAPTKEWPDMSVLPEHAVLGLYGVTLCLEGFEQTAHLLHDRMGYRAAEHNGGLYRYIRPNAPLGAIIDLNCAPYSQSGHVGVGSVHHVAFRTENDHKQRLFRLQLKDEHYNVSPQLDRKYFHSIYFREPGGVLFEIATDEPGFTVDEDFLRLGQSLCLPESLEDRRTAIEAALEPLSI